MKTRRLTILLVAGNVDVNAGGQRLERPREGIRSELVRAVVDLANRSDGGYADLADPSAVKVDRWLIRGDPAAGGLISDEAATRFEALLGSDRVITIARAPHSPHRTHPAASVAAILRALGAG